MTAANQSSSCPKIQPLLETFNDGELSSDSTLAVEAHLDACERCSEELRLLQCIQGSLRGAAHEEATVSSSFLNRLHASLGAERDREEQVRLADRQTSSLERWRSRAWPALAVAAAAVVWLWQPGARRLAQQPEPSPATSSVEGIAYGGPSVQELLDKLVDYHSHPPKPEVTEPSLVPRFEQRVGVRVEVPRLTQFGARWKGGSVVTVNNIQRAAFLNYDVPDVNSKADRRITVYVYDSERVPVHASLEPRMVGDQPVYVGRRRGYSIAARARSGIGYAIATDLDDQESAEIVASLGTLH